MGLKKRGWQKLERSNEKTHKAQMVIMRGKGEKREKDEEDNVCL